MKTILFKIYYKNALVILQILQNAVSLGLHKYIYNVLHKNARYNSEVFNLDYKNIFSIGLQNETFYMYRIQNFRILHYSLIIRTFSQEYINYNLFNNGLYHYIIHECIIYYRNVITYYTK